MNVCFVFSVEIVCILGKFGECLAGIGLMMEFDGCYYRITLSNNLHKRAARSRLGFVFLVFDCVLVGLFCLD